MRALEPGLVHTPMTPFMDGMRVDLDRYGRIIDFHLANGAQALALPMHVGESVSLSDDERKALLEFALRHVDGRVPVLAHVTQSGTAMAVALAAHAEQAGAAAIVSTTPYYWKPQPAMMLSHLAEIGAAVGIPYYLYNAPGEMGGTCITTDLVLELVDRLDNVAGVIDVSLDWQFLIDLVANARAVRPAFQLLSGIEFLISARAIGATGALAPHAIVAPALIRRLYDLCDTQDFAAARPAQEEFAALYKLLKRHGVAGLKTAAAAMGRDCGAPRVPVAPLGAAAGSTLARDLMSLPAVAAEVRGW